MKVWVLSDGGSMGGLHGVYSTLQAAEAARDRYQAEISREQYDRWQSEINSGRLPGWPPVNWTFQMYRDYRRPAYIDEYEVDVDRFHGED